MSEDTVVGRRRGTDLSSCSGSTTCRQGGVLYEVIILCMSRLRLAMVLVPVGVSGRQWASVGKASASRCNPGKIVDISRRQQDRQLAKK